jgi:signal transduction histidine kinase
VSQALPRELPLPAKSEGMPDLHAARDYFLATGLSADGVRPPVAAAWERTKALDVRPGPVRRQEAEPATLRAAQDRARQLLDAADPLIAAAHTALGDQPHLIALADAQGRIIRLRQDETARRLGASSNLFEGASWLEADLGCNGIGTALAVDEPVILIGPEHFVEDYVGWTCIGVPLHAADGRLVGAIDLSVPNEHTHIHSWGMILTLAEAVERRIVSELTPPIPLPALETPLQGARAALELLGQQLEGMPTHLRFLAEAADELRRTEGLISDLLASEREARARAETAVAAHNDFLSSVTHDVRNLLAVIEGRLALMKRRVQDSEVVRGLEQIESTARRLEAQIELLADIALLEAGQWLQLRETEFDLVALLRNLVTERDLTGSAIRLESAPLESLPVIGDEARLSRVFGNLLDNALKYGGEKVTTVRVRVEATTAFVDVADHGRGIPVADLPHIFERFFRASNVGNADGTGIGLAASKRIVQQHGGDISVASRVAHGTTFTVRLPLPSMS